MMTVPVFANVTTAGGREPLRIELDRDGVGPMIPNHFGGDFRVSPDRVKESVDIGFGFLTGDTRPLTFNRLLELFEFYISHTDGPGFRSTKCVDAAMVPYGDTGTLSEYDQSPTHAS